MRPFTEAQEDAVRTLHRRTRVFCEVNDGSGWIDLTAYNGQNWLISATVATSEDQTSATATVVFHREVIGISLVAAGAGIFTPGNQVRLAVELAEAGLSGTGRQELFEGRIDDVGWGGNGSQVSITARDAMARLRDAWIENVSQYGGVATTVMQSILDRWTPGVVLTTVGDPEFILNPYNQQIQSVEQALRAIVDLYGWDLRIRWLDGEWKLVQQEPQDTLDATPTPVATFGFDDYFEITDIGLSGLGVRDKVIMTFRTATEEVAITVQTPEPIQGPDYRTIFFDETRNSQIGSEGLATALATAILRTLARSPIIKQVTGPLDWRIELGDWVEFTPNGIHYDSTFEGAITGIEHRLSAEECSTTYAIRGGFAGGGGIGRWLTRIRRTRLIRETEEIGPPDPDFNIPLDPFAGFGGLFYTDPGQTAGYQDFAGRDDSLGKFVSKSRVTRFGVEDVFRAVTEEERADGVTLYRILGVVNETTGTTLTGWKLWITEQATEGVTFRVAVDPAGPQDLTSGSPQGEDIADEFTAPSGYTFDDPDLPQDGLSLGNIGPGQVVLIGVELEVEADAFGQIPETVLNIGPCEPRNPCEVES